MPNLRQTLRIFFDACNSIERYQWRKTNISPKQLKYLDSSVKQFFRYRLSGNIVYLQLKRDSFIMMPKNKKRIRALQQVQIEVKPIAFSV